MFKKIVSMLLIVSLIISSMSIVFAENDIPMKKVVSENGKKITTTVNEYEMHKYFKEKSETELKKQGYSEETIKTMKNVDFKAELEKRSKLDKDTLINLGYTNDKIEMLQNFTGTEEQMYALSSNLTMYVQLYGHYYDASSDRSRMSVYYGWEWASEPIVHWTDIIGYSYRTDYIKDPQYQLNSVTYRHSKSTSTDYRTYSIVGAGIGKAESTFPMSINIVGDPNQRDYYWAKSGYGQFGVYRSGYFEDAAIYVSYGHSTLTYNPSITFINFDLSIGFSAGVNIEGGGLVESDLNP